jgi:hypothetical protein
MGKKSRQLAKLFSPAKWVQTAIDLIEKEWEES